jgi:Na+/proline symporter
MPIGVRGLVIAAVFSVTMSTVSGALSASASSTVNDLYRPIFPRTGEKALLWISMGMTAFWGVVQMGVALAAERLDGSVVDNALTVASFVTGLLLGLFCLGLWTRDVGQRSAFLGLLAGTAAVTAVKFATTIAYPWYALVGSATVVAIGWLASRVVICPQSTSSKSRTSVRDDRSFVRGVEFDRRIEGCGSNASQCGFAHRVVSSSRGRLLKPDRRN